MVVDHALRGRRRSDQRTAVRHRADEGAEEVVNALELQRDDLVELFLGDLMQPLEQTQPVALMAISTLPWRSSTVVASASTSAFFDKSHSAQSPAIARQSP
jgi:hypothetical protein